MGVHTDVADPEPPCELVQTAGDVVDDRRAGPYRLLRHLWVPGVDRDPSSPASRATAGTTRSSSSSGETGTAPGRVDSPPTSTDQAPCSNISRPTAIARSVVSNLLPDQNESGVALMMPITRIGPTSGRVVTAPPSTAYKIVDTPQLYRDVIERYGVDGTHVGMSEEESPWVPFGENAAIRHLAFDVRSNTFSNILWIKGPGVIGTHNHRGTVGEGVPGGQMPLPGVRLGGGTGQFHLRDAGTVPHAGQ